MQNEKRILEELVHDKNFPDIHYEELRKELNDWFHN